MTIKSHRDSTVGLAYQLHQTLWRPFCSVFWYSDGPAGSVSTTDGHETSEKCKRLKKVTWETFFTSYLHNGSTLEHNSNRFRKLQCRATTFVLAIFSTWSCGHCPNMLLNELWQAESSLSWFSLLFGHTRSHFLLGVYVEDPDMDPEGSASLYIHCIHQLYFFLDLPLFFYLKYSKFFFWTYTLNLTTAIWKFEKTI